MCVASGNYVGEAELFVVANMLKINIHIYLITATEISQCPMTTYSFDPAGPAAPAVQLAFLKGAHAIADHYDLVLPEQAHGAAASTAPQPPSSISGGGTQRARRGGGASSWLGR